MTNEIKDKTSIVTLVEDPFGVKTIEISEAQNEMGELDLDSDLTELSEPENFETPETMDAQLDRLTQSLAEQQKLHEQEAEASIISESLPSLEEQIAEDQAISQEEIASDSSPTSEFIDATSMDLAEIQSCIEALLFISDKPLSPEKLRGLLGSDFSLPLFQEAMTALKDRYQATHHGIELVEVSGGYQFRTKSNRTFLAKKLVKVQTQRLSSGCMETLAIIAYRQPVMKEEIDKIRGVDSSYFVRGLMEKKLIQISGRSELPGKPMLYSTTDQFLELFSLKDLSALPSLRELEQMIPASQAGNPEEEDPRVREMRRLVSEMKSDRTSALYYNPKEDDKILKEFRERVNAIPTSTPYLDEVKAAEILAHEQQENLGVTSDKSEV
jgi:segregation and condensation protein B